MTEPSKPPRRRRPVTKSEGYVALGMKAAGLSNKKIAQALELSPMTVPQVLKRIPDVTEQLNVYRDNLRLRKMKSIYDADERLWNRINRDVETADAKDVDALFRAAHASEKMSASLAGEAQKVDVKTDAAPNVDLKVLIQTLGLEGLKDLG